MRTAFLLAVLLGLLAACTAPAPRIPFRDTAWHASAVGGKWSVSTFVKDADVLGLELVLDQAGTSGWALEFGARYASGSGDGTRIVFDPLTGVFDQPADSKREIDFYELDFGARQVYRPDERLQPYVGVGAALLQARSTERWVQPALLPNFPADTPLVEHERTKIRPGLYFRTGLLWNVLRDQLREKSEVPLAFDVRTLLSTDYSYIEFSLAFGFGR
ncbi:MAG: hypothetical protein HOP15_10920 [Planctomycetes bacterium]|nr:hypothetical protein [Planctomycetota bacterium]